MPKRSAGLLMYKRAGGALRLLLVHPGGPFWAKKDSGTWSIPKGEYVDGEDPLAVARREFAEELGCAASGALWPLGEITQAGRKVVTAWAIEGCYGNHVEHFRDGVAAEERPPSDVPGGRPCRMVHGRGGAGKDAGRTAAIDRPARGRDRALTQRRCRILRWVAVASLVKAL
jgi:predicted NUDIX family NTP pyrophosphohydrolase